MYTISVQPFGFQMIFADAVGTIEMLAWLHNVEQRMATAPAVFGILLDIRQLIPLAPMSRLILAKGMQLLQVAGLNRCAVVVLAGQTRREFTWLAQRSGVYQWERYLSEEEMPDWQRRATAWIVDGIDPDA